jgi:branched-chain amino acid aminotransferase
MPRNATGCNEQLIFSDFLHHQQVKEIPMALVPFDDRDGTIWFDGKMMPWRSAQIHVLTHALHYASCVFEGERVYGGQVFKLSDHSERLVNSGRILGFELPYSVAELDSATRQVVAANGIIDGYVRPLAWRGSEQMGVSAPSSKIHVAIATWLWPSYFPTELRQKGIRLTFAKWRRPHPETAPTASKAAGLYMICTMSKHDAENAGYQDALMLDWRGQIAEATGANIFLAMDGKLHTPTPDCFLDGITRRTVIDLARARGIDVVERAIFPEELAKTQEVFLTGTAAEITPVGEIGDYRFTPGALTRQLLADFDRAVGRPEAAAAQ